MQLLGTRDHLQHRDRNRNRSEDRKEAGEVPEVRRDRAVEKLTDPAGLPSARFHPRQRSDAPVRNPVPVQLGTVVRIERYPIKGLRGESLRVAEIAADGLAGDRTTALIVRNREHARSGKTYRGKEHAQLHTVAAFDEAERLASSAGVALDAAGGGRFFDALPVSLIFDSWLGDLEAILGYAIDALRFRPNIVAAAVPSFTGREAGLTGARLQLGSAELMVVEPIVRCVTPSFDLATGERDGALARAIVHNRGNIMGVYCTVTRPGTLACGDSIERL
jgi:uncharacterized protein